MDTQTYEQSTYSLCKLCGAKSVEEQKCFWALKLVPFYIYFFLWTIVAADLWLLAYAFEMGLYGSDWYSLFLVFVSSLFCIVLRSNLNMGENMRGSLRICIHSVMIDLHVHSFTKFQAPAKPYNCIGIPWDGLLYYHQFYFLIHPYSFRMRHNEAIYFWKYKTTKIILPLQGLVFNDGNLIAVSCQIDVLEHWTHLTHKPKSVSHRIIPRTLR